MIKVSLRRLLLGSAVTAGLVASAGMAQAVEYNFGSVKVNLDTTISAGASVGTSPVDHALLPTSEGGPVSIAAANAGNVWAGPGYLGVNNQTAVTTDGTGDFPTNNLGGVTSTHGISIYEGPATVAGSINTGDSRLNFGRGDLFSSSVKMTNDLSASWQNYHFFGRLSSYYDAVLNNDSSYNVRPLTDGKADAARDVKILDFYASADYNVADMPLNVRVGKQVISWGESTFIQNGINVINPVDVAAVRRPGSELKEFFIPVWAADASIGLPFNLSLEAFYQFKWDTYALDRGGTPFAASDNAAIGATLGGASFLTGSYTGSANCSNPNAVNDIFNNLYGLSGDLYARQRTCGDLAIDYAAYNGYNGLLGGGMGVTTKATKLGYQDNAVVKRGEDDYAKNSGQWGVAARWYSEDLNNTEFGVYFMNYHSRLPFVNEAVVNTAATSTWGTVMTLGSLNTTEVFAGAAPASCNFAAVGAGGYKPDGTAADTLTGVPFYLSPTAVAYLNTAPASFAASDPYGIFAAAENLAASYYSANVLGVDPTGGGAYSVVNAPAGNVFQAVAGGGGINTGMGAPVNLTSGTLSGGNFTFDNNFSVNSGTGSATAALDGVTVNRGSVLESMIVNCALIANQAIDTTTALLNSPGTAILSPSDIGLRYNLVYPEDIKMVGASFNTTVGTWGVQGEFSYRPEAPFQLDTDQMTIAALGSSCVFPVLFGSGVYEVNVAGLQTMSSACGQTGTISGVVKSKMWTAQVGTTATYSNSNPLISGTGADLGILVTEVGMVYVPDAQSAGNQGALGTRWANLCTGGTDVPLGGALSLAPRSGCRPSSMSWGFVLLGQLQYNNAFGTAVNLQPTMAFSMDVQGNTPAPYSNYEQGRKSLSLGLNASFQSSWKAGINYTNFFGTDKFQNLADRDNLSASISYAF